jgi:hypothetical protein
MYFILDNLVIKAKVPSSPPSELSPGRTSDNFPKKDFYFVFTWADFLKQTQNLWDGNNMLLKGVQHAKYQNVPLS